MNKKGNYSFWQTKEKGMEQQNINIKDKGFDLSDLCM